MRERLTYYRFIQLVLIASLGLLFNCKSNTIAQDKTYSDELAQLQMLLDEETYYIDIEVAFPFTTAATQQVFNELFLSRTGNTASRIDVTGDGHFIEIKNDSVKGDLSFFGERRMNSGPYGSTNTGIGFEGVPENYEKFINKDKRKLEIKFKTNQKDQTSESYDVSLDIYPSRRVEVRIASTFKTFMRYTGTLKSSKKELQ